VGGFFRSLQFTSLNGLAYAEIEHARMSPASTLSSMSQQLTQSVGVGLAAVLLNISMQVQHSTRIDTAALAPVFVIIGLFTMLGHFWFYRLSPEDGAEMSGATGRGGRGARAAAAE
ncbi:MAG: MFS transporter, partial [Hyphomonadaceae bacterium]